MGVTLMHHLKAQVGTIQNVSPSVDHATIVVQERLVEIKAVEIEGHSGDSKSGKPDTYNRPGSKEEVK